MVLADPHDQFEVLHHQHVGNAWRIERRHRGCERHFLHAVGQMKGNRKSVRSSARMTGDIECIEFQVIGELFHVGAPIDHFAPGLRG